MMRFTNYCPKIQKHVQVLILATLQLVCFSESFTFAFTFTTPTYTYTRAHIDRHMHINRHPVTAISKRFGFALGAESNNSENSVILEDQKNNNSQTTDSTTSEVTGTGTGTGTDVKTVNVDFNIRSKSTNSKSGAGLFQKFNEASAEGFGTKAKNAMNTMSNGDIVVPLCGNLELRQALANRGIYAGVEYEICSLQLPNIDADADADAVIDADIDAVIDADDKKETEQEQTINISISTMEGLTPQQQESVSAIIKPAYKLRDHLERTDWPVTVHPSEVPLWLSKTTWEAGTLVGTLSLAVSYLSIAAILAFFVRFAYVPSPSMEPVLNPGNVVLVTRSIPVGFLRPHVGDVVLFDPPSELNRIVREAASNANEELVLPQKGEQFLKRVVAAGGEYVGVKNSSPYVDLSISESQSQSQNKINNDNIGDKKKFRVDVIGPYAQPGLFSQTSWDRPPSQLTKNQYFVAGDNGFRSVDSRVWGPVESRNIFGTAKFVLWPLKDFGPVKDGPIFTIEK